MLLAMDSFDHYATADITKKYTSKYAPETIAASSGRRGGGALSTTSGLKVVKAIPATTSFVIGFAFNNSAAQGGSRAIVILADAGTNQCDIRINADFTLSVTRNGTAVTNGTSTSALSASTWNYIEWKVTIADSIGAGSCVVKVNGTTWITVATGEDLKNTANATANQFWFGDSGSMNGTWLFDDFYLCDQSGASNNDFLGDCRVDCVFPSADGSNSAWTPSTGTDHYALVDEATPNTSDYVETAGVGDKDTWAFGNLSAVTGTIYGVQVSSAVLKDDAGARSIANTCKSSSTDADGATQALSTSQLFYMDIFATDPNTSSAWTEANFNAAEWGVKLAA